MPLIRPISDLRNRAMEISELCHKEGQPVFITRNGKGDMVVMSLAHYERLQCLLELYQKLGEAESLGASGEQGITHEKTYEEAKRKNQMSGPFEIRYLSTTENDLDNIFDYIMKDNPSAAVSLLKKFDYSISQLAINPEIGVVPKDYRLKKLGYRILIIGKYLVFYVVKANTVQIRRIIHGARQYSFLL